MSNIEKANQFKALGNEAFKSQKYEEAIEFFSKAIECNPNDHVFYSNRSGSYLNSGNYEKAYEDAENCIKLNPSWPRGYQRKGTALFYQQKIDEAINVYKQGLKIDPNNADLQKDLKAAESKQNEEEGMPDMSQMNPQYLQAMIKLMSHPETKDFINDPTFMQKVQIVMKNPQMAQVLIQQDPKLKKAFQILSSDVNPADVDGLKKMFEGRDIPFKQGDKKKQESQYQPSQPRSQQKQEYKKEQKAEKMEEEESPAESLKNQGNEYFKKKNFNEALNLYEEAIRANPNEPLYYNNKAAAYIELGELDNALEEISKAENLFNEGVSKDFIKKAKVLARKATILSKQEKYEEAITAYEKSLLEDQNSKVKDQLNKIKKQKKEKEAKQYLNSELGEKHCEEGNKLYKEGNFPAALKEYEEAIRRNPEVAKYYSNLGTVYIKLMEFSRAKDNFDLALKKDENFVKAYPKKGDCHFFLKEFHKALAAYQAGLKKDPENELCKQGIQKTQAAIYSSNANASNEDQEQRAKRAMADPEIQAILNTPEVRNALAEMERDPKSIQNILKNKSLAEKIDKLIQAGILRMG